MSKSLQYLKVLEVLKNANGPVTVSDVKSIDGIVATRLSTYLWEIKKHTGFAVKSNRDGRTVVSYELVGSGTVSVSKIVATAPVVIKPQPLQVKSQKPVKSKFTPVFTEDEIVTKTMKDVVMKDSMIFDALDEIETNIQDIEDRSFAENYVKTL